MYFTRQFVVHDGAWLVVLVWCDNFRSVGDDVIATFKIVTLTLIVLINFAFIGIDWLEYDP